ncbi:hypothetical protein HYALB_00006941 [Hymenoscyphus albidus]|uniref:Uncharacterized protein n=1 Tax=Hymenoscyphus albidus TaxID=595503 RepID=A0A9N9LGZ0_9HELO|nr:hypothetical protein HYALB_00006941 [Hymenoscyphus albidus]
MPQEHRGYNPFHGFDSGPPPPRFGPRPHQPPAVQFGGYLNNWAPVQPSPMPPPFWGQPPRPSPIVQHFHSFPAHPPFPPYPPASGPPQSTQPPVENPIPDLPGTVLRNPFGEQGAPSDYSIMFPGQYCPIHLIKTATKPWEYTEPLHLIEHGPQLNFNKILVPTSISVKDLMANCGCNNPDAKKNRVYEVTEDGAGRWKKGLEIGGDEADKVKKSISDWGWNEKRTGKPGAPPVVWLYMTKD